MNKHTMMARNPVTRITGSLGPVLDKGTHMVSDRHTHAPSPKHDLPQTTCAALHCMCRTELPLCLVAWKLKVLQDLQSINPSNRSKTPPQAQLPAPSLAGKDSTAQHYRSGSESHLHKDAGLKKDAFQIRKKRTER